MPRKSPDLDANFDFNIHVDSSCLSTPMDDDSTPTLDNEAQACVEEHVEAAEGETAGERAEPDNIPDEDTGSNSHESVLQQALKDEQDGTIVTPNDAKKDSDINDPTLHENDELTTQDLGPSTLERDIDSMLEQIREPTENSYFDHHNETAEQGADVGDTTGDCSMQEDTTTDEQASQEKEPVATEDNVQDEMPRDTCEDEVHEEEMQAAQEDEDAGVNVAEEIVGTDDAVNLTTELIQADDAVDDVDGTHEAGTSSKDQDSSSQVNSLSPQTDRRTSLRTEALIQAAARAVVAKIEERAVAAVHSRRNSQLSSTYDNDVSLLSRAASPHQADLPMVHLSPTSRRRSRPDSPAEQTSVPVLSEGDEGDSSSPHEADSDVFSDRSARSSIGSFEIPVGEDVKTPVRNVTGHDDTTICPSKTRSPRISNVSSISGISIYDKEEEYITAPRPKERTPRMPFRTPSSVRALQMSSPTPSVFNGASPRSHRRSGGGGGNELTVSRLGSPMASTQFSPKGRSTPPRLKSRKEAPLVLLHVTLLPLRWMWGEVINGLDSAVKDGFVGDDKLGSLRDAWRQLQDRVGDTVLERGVLLPHPQNDYEVLEERLLEALELPLRRRARILQCGHYLGPSNITDLADETQSESEDEYEHAAERRNMTEKRHWCTTCQNEIKYENLGSGKVFRINVYASNGLMKAGAWEACWKEMERVDVEVEPIVDTPLQRELERLSAFQVESETRRREEEDQMAIGVVPDDHLPAQNVSLDEHPCSPPVIHASPPSPVQLASSPLPLARSPTPYDNSEERRLRDEARLREIYGPPPTPFPKVHVAEDDAAATSVHPEPRAEEVHVDQQNPCRSFPGWDSASPSEEAHVRRTQRRTRPSPYQSASLPELMLESVKVLLRDRRNVAILVLSLLVLFLAVRPKTHELGRYRIEVPLDQEYRFTKAPDTVVSAMIEVESIHPMSDSIVVDVMTHSTGDGKAATTSTELPEEATTSSAVGEDNESECASDLVASTTDAKNGPDEFSFSHSEDKSVTTSDQPYTHTLDMVSATVNDVVSASTDSVFVTPKVEEFRSEDHTDSESAVTTEPAPTSVGHDPTMTFADEAIATTITEKKVVRIVETITEIETVRISVTSTESVPSIATTTLPSVGSNAPELPVFELGGPYLLPAEELAPETEILGPLTLCGEVFC